MDVRLISESGVRQGEVADLAGWLDGGQGVVWVDIPAGDLELAQALAGEFGFRPQMVEDAAA